MDSWTQRWNERYKEEGFAFGAEPNVYLKEQLDKLPPGKILFAAEGEGRNAIYAAKCGWETHAFDIAVEGKNKAIKFAADSNVSLDYQIGQLPYLKYEPESFDAIALIYAHFPAEIKSQYHAILHDLLKKGGVVIFEAYGKNHLPYREKNPRIGGPNNIDQLTSSEELMLDFPNYDIIEMTEGEVELKEGDYHQGVGWVTRFVGKKKFDI